MVLALMRWSSTSSSNPSRLWPRITSGSARYISVSTESHEFSEHGMLCLGEHGVLCLGEHGVLYVWVSTRVQEQGEFLKRVSEEHHKTRHEKVQKSSLVRVDFHIFVVCLQKAGFEICRHWVCAELPNVREMTDRIGVFCRAVNLDRCVDDTTEKNDFILTGGSIEHRLHTQTKNNQGLRTGGV